MTEQTAKVLTNDVIPDMVGLQKAMDLVGGDLTLVNGVIIEHLTSDVPLIPEIAQHLIAAGGKRIRPLMTLLAAKLYGYEGDRHRFLAACVEFIHTATLLHDDVVDASDLRRGRESANAIWGNQSSVLVGDFLFSRAFQLMVADGDLEVLKILCDASARIAEGEVFQLTTAQDLHLSLNDYFKVIESKTAVLFAAASEVGAVVAKAPKGDQEHLRQLGLHLGILFQLMDDVLDYKGHKDSFGKNLGNDFKEGKMTLPLLLTIQATDKTHPEFWIRTIEKLDQRPEDFNQVLALMDEHHIFTKCQTYCKQRAKMALDELDQLPSHGASDAFRDMIHFCLNRVN